MLPTATLIKDEIQKALTDQLHSRSAPLLVPTCQAALILGLSESTLEKWRHYKTQGTPPFVRIGRACRYRLSDLRDWVEQQG